ncbi:unnamed protein product [Somion occarium]|uniref:DBF4-type domain-containing protein n=1 Tax=Somion occarium TaxID=3059160 RepID=A0ABP1DGN6_9APHY
MAAVLRNPLGLRPLSHQLSPSPSTQIGATKPPSAKRSRSPELIVDGTLQSSKRVRGVDQSPAPGPNREELKKEKERRRIERENEFKIKYTRAFPSWVFYFDIDAANPDAALLREQLVDRVTRMGAHVEDFFSKEVTHLITTQPEESFANKENNLKHAHLIPSPSTSVLRSPIKLRGRAAKDVPAAQPPDHLIKKALTYAIKIWDPLKLDSVLDRCGAPPACLAGSSTAVGGSNRIQAISSVPRERSLTRLLEAERIHGTTERDPTQKRSDYIYFSKTSYYVLVEDMNQELATIAALEYPIHKDRDGQERGTWPVLHCHPRARGPFVEYNEREERRREKADKIEAEREWDRERRKAKLLEAEKRRKAQQQVQRNGDLRRSVSMKNLHRRASFPQAGTGGFVDLDADFDDGNTMASANASGYLASGAYMAASGNSVSITSTTGTTSTAGHSSRMTQLNPSLKGLMQQQVVTSRKAATNTTSAGKKENIMGPPLSIPERPNNMLLRKSRSTNTLRLPKREEGMKPGYCESCRVKFEDFKHHIIGRRHRKYATDDANFTQLDLVLSRMRRRTLQDVAAERRGWNHPQQRPTADHHMYHLASEDMAGEDVQWDDWVEHDETS